MNCRADRVDRTQQFARDVLPYIDGIGDLVLIGETTSPIVDAYNEGLIKANELHNLENKSTEQILEVLEGKLSNRVIYGVGNIHGSGEPLIEALQSYRVKKLAG